jgi:PAS domain S-box-containing protein
MSAVLDDFRHLFRLLPHNYLLLRPDGTIVENSDRHVAVSMLPREQSAGRNIFEAYPSAPESQRELNESHEYVRRHRQPHTMPVMRYDLLRPEVEGGGFEQRYWQITHYPILDDAGELRYILQHPEDVTAQQQAEQQRQAAEQALAEAQTHALEMLDALPILIWTARPDGSTRYLNQHWLAYTGHPAGHDLGQDWLDVVHPDDRARVADSWAEAVRTQTTHEQEYRLRRHDGQYRWHLVRTVPQRGADGRVRSWVGCGTDIEDQRRLVQELTDLTEQQLQLVEQAVQGEQQARHERETFHRLFMQAPALIAIVRGPQYIFEFANPPYFELFVTDELVGRPVLDVIPEAAEQGYIALLDQVYQTGETFQGKEMLVKLHRRATGQIEERYFDMAYQAYRENGQIVGIFSFALDVTERVHLRKRVEQLLRLSNQADV